MQPLVAAFVDRVERDVGPIENLVNVAGIQRLGLLRDLAERDFAATFDVNVRGVFNVTRAVAGRMMSRGRGAIVTIASNASRGTAGAAGRLLCFEGGGGPFDAGVRARARATRHSRRTAFRRRGATEHTR